MGVNGEILFIFFPVADDLSDLIPILYPLTLDRPCQMNYIKASKPKMVTSSEKLCAAKATLYSNASIDSYAYNDQNCFLGEFTFTNT